MKILLFPVLIYSFSGMVRKFKDPYFYECAFTFTTHSPWFLAPLNSATFAFTLCKEVFPSPVSVRAETSLHLRVDGDLRYSWIRPSLLTDEETEARIITWTAQSWIAEPMSFLPSVSFLSGLNQDSQSHPTYQEDLSLTSSFEISWIWPWFQPCEPSSHENS